MSRRRLHPFTGALASVGGLIGGLGVGLAMREPAAGLLAGLGLGMIITTLLRAYGRWPIGRNSTMEEQGSHDH